MDHDITRYLDEHLAASSSALLLIRKLADTHDGPGARGFFLDLQEAFEADQTLLENLLERIGQEPPELGQRSGGMDTRSSPTHLAGKELDPENLRRFETLEMLALGLESKHLLWRVLREIAVWFHEWDGIDFDALDLRASRQHDGIEFWRIREGVDILADRKRRIDIEEVSRETPLQSPLTVIAQTNHEQQTEIQRRK